MKKLVLGIFLVLAIFTTYSVAMAESATPKCSMEDCKCKYQAPDGQYTNKDAIVRCFVVTGQPSDALEYAEKEKLSTSNVQWAAVMLCKRDLKNGVKESKEFYLKYKLDEACNEDGVKKVEDPVKAEKAEKKDLGDQINQLEHRGKSKTDTAEPKYRGKPGGCILY